MFTITTVRFKKDGENPLIFANTESNGMYPYDNAIDELKRVHRDASFADRLESNIETISKLKKFDRITIEIYSFDDSKCWFLYINKVD